MPVRALSGSVALPAMWLVSAVSFAVLAFIGYVRFETYRAGVDDGIFLQILASAGGGFSSTVEGNHNHLAVHCSPILFLIAPFVTIAHSGLALVFVQAGAFALVGPPLFLIARKRMPELLALLAASVALAYPPLVALATGDFHELSLAPAATLWLVWSIDARRWWITGASAFCALAIKEDELLVLGVLGVAVMLYARTKRDAATFRVGAFLCLAAISLFAGYFAILRPAVAHGLPYWSFHFYDWGSSNPSPLAYAPFDSPVRAWYVWWAVLPLAGICLLSPAIVLALPGLVEVMSSHEAIAINLSTHYVATWVPYVLFAWVLGVARIAERRPSVGFAAVGVCLLLTAWTDVYANPSSWYRHPFRWPDDHDWTIGRLIDSVPIDASIGTTLNIYPHLAMHPAAGLTLAGSDYILIDRTCTSDYCRSSILPQVDALVASNRYLPIRRVDGIELLRARPSVTAHGSDHAAK